MSIASDPHIDECRSIRPRVALIGLAGVTGSRHTSCAELGARFDLSPEQIVAKTGVTGLRRLGRGESLVELAGQVGAAVLERAGVPRRAVTAVFGSSNPTSEDLLPTFTAAAAHALGLADVIVDHVGIGCCGGLQALRNAWNQLTVDALDGRIGHALVIAGDHTSRILDPRRRQTGTLFGEGVSVALLTNDPAARTGYAIDRIVTRSALGEALYALRLKNPYAQPPGAELPRLEMDGARVFEFGADAARKFLALLGLPAMPEGCYLVPHQPNLRMLDALVERAGLDVARVYVDGIRTIGNTSAPAAMLGLEDALRRGLVDATGRVMLGAFGAELQVGAALLSPLDPLALVADPPLVNTRVQEAA